MKKKRHVGKQPPAGPQPRPPTVGPGMIALALAVTALGSVGIWKFISKHAEPAAPAPPLAETSSPRSAMPMPASFVRPEASPSAVGPLPEGGPRAYSLLPANMSPHLRFWWNGVPDAVKAAALPPAPISNVRATDYAGPDTCKKCHAANYKGWSEHPHRWMNANATPETVKGDFSGHASIDYRGGQATFFQADGGYRMRLARGGVERTFNISRTIGSRFYQYYIGTLAAGPEASDNLLRKVEHVLPFGYWIGGHEWVPTVHVSDELPDEQREDPYANPSTLPYDLTCAICHTTRPFGDWMMGGDSSTRRIEYYAPHPISFQASAYLEQAHPEIAQAMDSFNHPSQKQFARLLESMEALPPNYAVSLGITCEACHNGSKQHVAQSTETETSQPPLFYPAGPLVYVEGSDAKTVWGRNRANENWICARCHSGGRPQFAAGMATWNSTEYSDAELGKCFDAERARSHGMDQLTCVTCHNPHKATGPKWSGSPAEDDAKCLKCHGQFTPAPARLAHTHHPDGTPGSRCMNCHMPKINEGIEDVVRTHTIFNPTEPRMIEANQPNACNLCHLDKPIDWTLDRLREWYGKTYDFAKLAANYPDRQAPAALGWLKSRHESTRLVAAEALTSGQAKWALAGLIDMLDDPYLLNRQFTQKGLEQNLGLQPKDFGYRFYQFKEERKAPLARLRAAVLAAPAGAKAGQP